MQMLWVCGSVGGSVGLWVPIMLYNSSEGFLSVLMTSEGFLRIPKSSLRVP